MYRRVPKGCGGLLHRPGHTVFPSAAAHITPPVTGAAIATSTLSDSTRQVPCSSPGVLHRARFPILRNADLRIGEVELAVAHE